MFLHATEIRDPSPSENFFSSNKQVKNHSNKRLTFVEQRDGSSFGLKWPQLTSRIQYIPEFTFSQTLSLSRLIPLHIHSLVYTIKVVKSLWVQQHSWQSIAHSQWCPKPSPDKYHYGIYFFLLLYKTSRHFFLQPPGSTLRT